MPPVRAMVQTAARTGDGRNRISSKGRHKRPAAQGPQVLTWAARPITRQGHNVELDMELVDLKMAHRDPGPTWDHAQKARWLLSDRGKTVRFVTDQLPSESLRGLPDLELLFRHLMPALPNQPVGPGAKWSLHQRFSMRLPGPTGTGTLVVTERIQYHWTNLANGKAHIQARLSSKYFNPRVAVSLGE